MEVSVCAMVVVNREKVVEVKVVLLVIVWEISLPFLDALGGDDIAGVLWTKEEVVMLKSARVIPAVPVVIGGTGLTKVCESLAVAIVVAWVDSGKDRVENSVVVIEE